VVGVRAGITCAAQCRVRGTGTRVPTGTAPGMESSFIVDAYDAHGNRVSHSSYFLMWTRLFYSRHAYDAFGNQVSRGGGRFAVLDDDTKVNTTYFTSFGSGIQRIEHTCPYKEITTICIRGEDWEQ
jgi:hypothetical protein